MASITAVEMVDIFEAERRWLEGARASLDRERAAFRVEKEAVPRAATQGNSVLELNVGGRLFSTTRALLAQEEGLLAGMFSGRWEQSFAIDHNGHAFLDFDPDCFEVVLYHLRLRWLTGRLVDWREVEGPQGKEEYFEALTGFLGFTQTQVSHPGSEVAFGMCSPNLSGAGGTTVTHTSANLCGWAVVDQLMESGEFTWGFRVRNLPASGVVRLGVVGAQSPANAISFNHGTGNGWYSGGCVLKNGVATRGDGGWQGFENGDEVRMRLKAAEGVLQMKVARLGDEVFEIAGLGQHPWRVHAYLYGSDASVELIASDF